MAQWRYRPPGDFPPSFHEAMMRGEGADKIAGLYMTVSGARDGQKRFRLFRFCVRNTPVGPLYQYECELYHRTRIAWSEPHKRWVLYLTSKPSALSGLKNPEDLA